MFVWPHNEIILGPSWELGAYNLQHRGYRGTQVGVGNLDFCNIVGPNWELGIWEFIAKNDIVGGHLGKQKHCPGGSRKGTVLLYYLYSRQGSTRVLPKSVQRAVRRPARSRGDPELCQSAP